MSFTVDQYITMVENFITTGTLGRKNVPEGFRFSAFWVITERQKASLIEKILSAMPLFEKHRYLLQIKAKLEAAYATAQSDPNRQSAFERRYRILPKIKSDTFLAPHMQRILRVHSVFDNPNPTPEKPQKPDNGLPKQINFAYTQPIEDNPTRFKEFAGDESHSNVSAYAGSTYFSSDPAMQEAKEAHLLDALEVVEIDTHTEKKEYAIAVADGCGGHRGNAREDKAIAKAAKVAAKDATLMLAAYQDADVLVHNMRQLIDVVADKVRAKSTEKTTISVVRSFVQENGTLRVVGFSIGDSLIVAFDPRTKMMKNILPARTTVNAVMAGTSNFPIVDRSTSEESTQILDEILPAETILFAMTDGGFEPLQTVSYDPFEYDTEANIARGAKYQDTCLDPRETPKIFEPVNSTDKSVRPYLSALWAQIVTNTEQKRQDKIAAKLQADIYLQSPEYQASEQSVAAFNRFLDINDMEFPLVETSANTFSRGITPENLNGLFVRAAVQDAAHQERMRNILFPLDTDTFVEFNQGKILLGQEQASLANVIAKADKDSRMVVGGDDVIVAGLRC